MSMLLDLNEPYISNLFDVENEEVEGGNGTSNGDICGEDCDDDSGGVCVCVFFCVLLLLCFCQFLLLVNRYFHRRRWSGCSWWRVAEWRGRWWWVSDAFVFFTLIVIFFVWYKVYYVCCCIKFVFICYMFVLFVSFVLSYSTVVVFPISYFWSCFLIFIGTFVEEDYQVVAGTGEQSKGVDEGGYKMHAAGTCFVIFCITPVIITLCVLQVLVCVFLYILCIYLLYVCIIHCSVVIGSILCFNLHFNVFIRVNYVFIDCMYILLVVLPLLSF